MDSGVPLLVAMVPIHKDEWGRVTAVSSDSYLAPFGSDFRKKRSPQVKKFLTRIWHADASLQWGSPQKTSFRSESTDIGQNST